MIKVKTTATTYKSVVLRRAILICWALLFVCFGIKLFGGNYFAIMVNSPRFVQFCQFLDNNIVLYGLIGLVSSFVSYGLFYLALLRQLWFTKKQLLIFVPLITLFCVCRIFTDKHGMLSGINLILNISQFFILPHILGLKITKQGIVRNIIGNVLNFTFQLIAVITKSIGTKIFTDSSLVTLIFMIDMYIMLMLYYLYSNNAGKENE